MGRIPDKDRLPVADGNIGHRNGADLPVVATTWNC